MAAGSIKGIGTTYIGDVQHLPHPVHACRVLAANADPARPAPPSKARAGPGEDQEASEFGHLSSSADDLFGS